MSIVLVIIGLLAGAILVGHDMIKAATIRSQISQIDKYYSAVNAFRVKYNVLPGDMTPNSALDFGMAARAGTAGRGDKNGSIEAGAADAANYVAGETALFLERSQHCQFD